MSSSGIHHTGAPVSLQQPAGADGQQSGAGEGSFRDMPVQIVASGEEQTTRPDTSGWKQNAGQIVGADTGGGVQDDGEYENPVSPFAPKEGETRSRKESAGQGDRYAKAPTPANGQGSAGKGESVYQGLQPSGRGAGPEGQYQSLVRPDAGGQDDGEYENPVSPFAPKEGDSRSRKESAGQGDRYAKAPTPANGQGSAGRGESVYQGLQSSGRGGPEGQYQSLVRPDAGGQDDGEYENPVSPFAPKEGETRSRKESAGQGDRYARAPVSADGQRGTGRGESVYQGLQPSGRSAGPESQYQSLARPDGTGRDQENAYQNLPRPDGSGRGDDGVYENPYPTGRGAGRSGEGAYQNLPLPAGTPAGQYENVPPPSGEAVYSEVQPPPDELYETIPAAGGDDVYSEVQQPDELYETIPAAGEEGIYSEVGNGEDTYENPYLVSGSKLQDAAREARRGGLLKPLRHAVKASFRSFVSGRPTSRGEVKALAGNLRMVDQLRSANDGAHATLNRILSSRHAPEQLVAPIKDDPAFLRQITEFSRQLPKLAGDPAAATRIMETLDLPAADRQRFAEDFRTAAGLLDKLYQARFDPQDSGSAFRKFADRKSNPYEQRISRPDFGEQESGNLRNWLAYAVSYFEDCAQVMADSARGEDPEIDVQELARDIDRFVSRPAGEQIVFGSQQA